MRIIPVLDVMNGVVVRAVGGKRENYRPIVSKLTKSTEPIDVLKALIDVTGSDVAYVADLDAIGSQKGPSNSVLNLAESSSVKLWIDFGIRYEQDIEKIPRRSTIVPVIGTETMTSFYVAEEARSRFEDVVGSIDCFHQKPIGWYSNFEPTELAEGFLVAKIEQIIVLELASVGSDETNHGHVAKEVVISTEECASIYAGGGIRNRDDLKRFEDAGCAGVLIASALHDGTLA